MNYKTLLPLFCLVCCVSGAAQPAPHAAQEDTLTAFIRENPGAVDFNVIYEGTKLNLSANDDFLLVQLSVAHPALQMRFLMQNVSLYIDPTGKKKKRYEIVLPSALDVKDELQGNMPMPSQQDVQKVGGEAERPDIRPLIAALNKRGADYNSPGGYQRLGYQFFHVEHDRKNELLNYYVLVPKRSLMQDKKLSEKWNVGLFSVNDFAAMPPPEQQGEGGMMPPPMQGGDQQDIQELMRSDIKEWVKFSIDDVNNANIRQDATTGNDIDVSATQLGDSIYINIISRTIETQLTFLMQGLTLRLHQPDSLTFTFPDAAMVRDKVRRHPNEVKATLAEQHPQSGGRDNKHNVVRPDVQPLVAAINQAKATVTTRMPGRAPGVSEGRFSIGVERQEALMTFTAVLPVRSVSCANSAAITASSNADGTAKTLTVSLLSQPKSGNIHEYEGRRLSGTAAPVPRGMGEGLREGDAASRVISKTITLTVHGS